MAAGRNFTAMGQNYFRFRQIFVLTIRRGGRKLPKPAKNRGRSRSQPQRSKRGEDTLVAGHTNNSGRTAERHSACTPVEPAVAILSTSCAIAPMIWEPLPGHFCSYDTFWHCLRPVEHGY